MKLSYLAALLSVLLAPGGIAAPSDSPSSASPAGSSLARPCPDQMAFMDMELGAFFHFDLNTFTGQEHGDGFEPASRFAPTALDAEQWVRTAKAMGAKYAVLTARHEGGFCLWPTKTTDYSVRSSPYKGGQGDLVREFVDACHKYGLKVGLYHTAAYDAHETFLPADRGKLVWGKPEDVVRKQRFQDMGPEGRHKYLEMQVAQITELLTNYGEISYLWCDHWNGSDSTWRAVTEAMRKLQPHCIMMGPDVMTPGNEMGNLAYPMWNPIDTSDGTIYGHVVQAASDASLPNGYGLLETHIHRGDPLGKIWRCREVDTSGAFESGGWFWHPGKTPDAPAKVPKSLQEHINLYYRSVGLGANLIINHPPDSRGVVPDNLAGAAVRLGDEIQRRFGHPIAESSSIPPGNTVELAWKTPCRVDTIVTMENIADGQKVAAYTLEAMVDAQWSALTPNNHFPEATAPFNPSHGFETIGHKKIDRITPVITNRIRFRCLKSIEQPVELRALAAFNVDDLPASP